MKKLLSLALISSLLLSSTPTHAKHHPHKHAGNKVLSGAWQFVKIGGGLFMVCSGVAVGSVLCCGGGLLKYCCHRDCPCPGEGIGEQDAQKCKEKGTPVMIGGGILGAGGVFLGVQSIKSGIRGLRRLAHQKNKKQHKKHKRHIHMTRCS